jgi:hypothetical protein
MSFRSLLRSVLLCACTAATAFAADLKEDTFQRQEAAAKAAPVIHWSDPTNIISGMPITATQLNASASVGGTFAYVPPAGTVLAPGTHKLSVTFTPTDKANYTTATSSVSITVNVNGSLSVAAGQTYTFTNGTISGSVIMSGGTLVLMNSQIAGNLQFSGGRAVLTGARVAGNVQLNGGGTVSIGASTVISGNLQFVSVPAGSPDMVCGATVIGNLQVQGGGASVEVGSTSPACPGNVVQGNLQLIGNTGPIQVFSNTVSGNLQCFENSSITGGANRAPQKQGQCSSF